MTVIKVFICCCVPNLIKIGSRVWPTDAKNWMFNAPLLGNWRCHGNRSRTWWEATTQISSQSVHYEASYAISSIFQHGGRPPFWVLNILIFDHVTVTVNVVLICYCVPNFIKIGSRPQLLNVQCAVAGQWIVRFQQYIAWRSTNAYRQGQQLQIFKIQDGGQPPFWKLLYNHK